MKAAPLVATISAGVLALSAPVLAGQRSGHGGGPVHSSGAGAMFGIGSIPAIVRPAALPVVPPTVGVVVPPTGIGSFLVQANLNGLNGRHALGVGRVRGFGVLGWYAFPFVWPYAYGSAYGNIGNPADVPVRQPPANGYLRLDIEPRTAQVYVDGYYVGTVDDFNRNGGSLQAGPHQMEFRAPGFEPLAVPVQIASGQTVTYRTAMEPVRPPPPPPPAPVESPKPSSPQTFYLIPDCYVGNLPPSDVRLPPGCDLSRLQTYTIQH